MEFEKELEPAIGPALGYECYTVKHGVVRAQKQRLFRKPQNIAMFVLALEADFDETKYKRIIFNSYSDLQNFVSFAKDLAQGFREVQKEKLDNLGKDRDSSRRLERLEANFRKRQNEFWEEIRKVSFSISERA